MRRFILLCAMVAGALWVPVVAEAAGRYRAGQHVTLAVLQAGQRGVDEVMLPDECSSVIVTLTAPTRSIGKKSHASVTTENGRVLHSFGKVRHASSTWKFKPSRNFILSAGLLDHPPHYRLSATCVLTGRGAEEWNALSGY
jgi:hypothetical protein